jgi:endonuclease-3
MPSQIKKYEEMISKNKLDSIISYFREKYPSPTTELQYTSPYQLLVAVILSAQCTDKRVNMITPVFFDGFPDLESLSKASVEEVYELIKSCSYPNNKAKYLVSVAKQLVDEYNGTIPDDIDQLQKLPGIGRKSANVLALTLYDFPAIPVDTHVFRVADRLGLTNNARNPNQAEKQLMQIVPQEVLRTFHHWLVLHGRYVCKARKPNCNDCGLTKVCVYFNNQKK